MTDVHSEEEGFMVRQVMLPTKENSTISIPAEFYGKEVEVLIFPSFYVKENQTSDSIDNIFDKHLFPLANFKFDRDEANDYE